jgi:methylmalonyl-CoA mutase N-terminal domain/subunit
MERQAEAIFAKIRRLAAATRSPLGCCAASRDGWFMAEIADSAFAYQQQLEKGEKRVVGVNTLTGDVGDELEILRVSHEVELAQREVLAVRRADRDEGVVRAALADMVAAAAPTRTPCRRCSPRLVPRRRWARICGALKEIWGEYREASALACSSCSVGENRGRATPVRNGRL